MNKCPHCGAALKTLSRFCDACGSEIKAQPAACAESSNPKPEIVSASDLSDQVNKDLSLLSNQPPASKAGSFFTGLVTVPTFGLGYLVVKASGVFGRIGQSPERIKLALDQNLRTVQTSYYSDPQMKALHDKGRSELSSYVHRQHESRVGFILGTVVSAVVIAIVVISLAILIAKHAHAAAEAKANEVRQEAMEAAKQEQAAAEAKANEVRQKAMEAVKTAEALAVKNHADYIAKYVGEKPVTSPGTKRIAVLVADDKARDLPATQNIITLLQSETNRFTSGLLTEAAVADGNFLELFSGNLAEMQNMELTNNADTLLLVKKELNITKDSNFQNIVTANLTLTFHAISVASGSVLDSFALTSVGAGVTSDSAEALAFERLMNQFIKHKTKL
jgi:hypothetical protein